MGEGDGMDDPQICTDPTWEAPNFSDQAVTSMDDSRLNGSISKKNGHAKINGELGSFGNADAVDVKANGFPATLRNGSISKGKANGYLTKGKANGSVPNGEASGSIANGKSNGSVSSRKVNGTTLNEEANGSFAYGPLTSGKANGALPNGKAHGSALGEEAIEPASKTKVDGSVSNGGVNGSIPNGKTSEYLLNGKCNGFSNNDKANGLIHNDSNGSIFTEDQSNLLNGSTDGKIDEERNGLVDVYKNGIVEGLEVPHGDVRKTIRASMLGVQPNFKHYKWEIKWGHVFMIGFVHVWALLAIPSLPYVKWQTLLLRLFEGGIAGVGVTAGAHRLYCHRAYKATLPLHLFLLWAYSVAGQNTLFDWVRDHRVHHKFSETDADPHNANRGWFFSHCGWLMIRKHPEVLRRGKTVDMSDITDDPYIAIHSKIFYVLKTLTCHLIPILIPMMLWDEGFWVATNSMIFRFVFTLNATWSVNSFAHLWGDRPIDKRIFPGENWLVALLSFGEGWHNYHHVFPWDYKAAEWGPGIFNMATIFLDACAWLGLAYDLKQPSQELIRRTALRHGDGTWTHSHVLKEVPEPSVAEAHAKDI